MMWSSNVSTVDTSTRRHSDKGDRGPTKSGPTAKVALIQHNLSVKKSLKPFYGLSLSPLPPLPTLKKKDWCSWLDNI
jgi:hypothetical protein